MGLNKTDGMSEHEIHVVEIRKTQKILVWKPPGKRVRHVYEGRG